MACSRFELVPPASNSSVPVARSGHRIMMDDGYLYVLGGYNPDVVDESQVQDEEELNKRIFVEMWRFNFFFRQWRQLRMTGDCPQYLASHSASLHGKTLFTFGGSGIPFGVRSSQSLHMCRLDPRSDTVHWRLLPAQGQVPERKYGQCQLYQWPYLYIVGGTTGFVYNTDVHRYDMQTGDWTCLWDSQTSDEMICQSPRGRYRHEMVLHKQQLLVFGGGQSNRCFGFYTIPYFDLEAGKWLEHQTAPDPSVPQQDIRSGIPTPRRCHSIVQHNNAVFVYGGRSSSPLGDLWQLNLRTFQWSCLVQDQASPLRLYFHSASITSSGSMYIFGGVTGPNNEGVDVRTNSIYRVQLSTPTLQELARHALSAWVRRQSSSSPSSPSSSSSSPSSSPSSSSSLPQCLLQAGVPHYLFSYLHV